MNAYPKASTDLRKVLVFGFLSVLLGLGGFTVWSAFVPLDSAVIAPGTIKVGSERKQVQHLEGGIVKQLLVKEGDYVEAGQVLVLLDETLVGADHQVLDVQRQELKIREALLSAQRDAKSSIQFKDGLADERLNEWLIQQKESANALFNLSRDSLQNAVSVIDQQIVQLEEQISGDQNEALNIQDQISFMTEELESWQKLIDQRYANKLRYLELQSDLSDVKASLAALETRVSSSKAQIGELRFERKRLEKSFREDAASELVQVHSQIRELDKRMDSSSNILKRIEIKAPVDGKVVGLNVYTVGAVIRSGDTILEIVPEKDELVVGVRVNPIDIDKVRSEMDARVRMSSYKMHEFPEFTGKVESVSADVFQDEQSLESYYSARIVIPEGALPQGFDKKISPGMPAEVMIVTGQSTPAQYLMEPMLTAFRTAWRDS